MKVAIDVELLTDVIKSLNELEPNSEIEFGPAYEAVEKRRDRLVRDLRRHVKLAKQSPARITLISH